MVHPLVRIGAVIAGGWLLGKLFGKDKIFISYYYRDDRHLKRLLNAWSKNKEFPYEFDDVSADVSLQTTTDEELEAQLTARIEKADVVLVLIGRKTHKRKWVAYEIAEAVRLSKFIVAVKQKRNHVSPKELRGVGAKWVYAFKAEPIADAIKECF